MKFVKESVLPASVDEVFAFHERPDAFSLLQPPWERVEVITPPRYSVRKSKERMEEALEVIDNVYDLVANEVSPEEDFHMLGLWHDLRNMTYCSELYMKAALERKETRGWHVREDYPEQDDQNWRKWIIQKMDKGEMKITFKDIPLANYKYNP